MLPQAASVVEQCADQPDPLERAGSSVAAKGARCSSDGGAGGYRARREDRLRRLRRRFLARGA